ncbi:uncharacterized protein LOC126827565 isoform X2 [Patella vulgata]|nr:uncharacterized protein LOC126827565 isoform X2 [Patella vulgata]XP_055958074.1 uncharacterized protein LOC126827565 isoform X2 [Patella vulgata]
MIVFICIVIAINRTKTKIKLPEYRSRFVSSASIIQEWPGLKDYEVSYGNKTLPKIHLICTLPLLTYKDVSSFSYKGAKSLQIQERMSELLTGLQRNLNHKCVTRVYFLYNEQDVVDFVKTNIQTNKKKLSFNLVSDPRNQTVIFDFAYDNLRGKLVSYTSADVYFGEGFELINKQRMVSNKLMYILSRHGRQEKYCDMRTDSQTNACDAYKGSHDTYIFVPTGEFPTAIRKHLAVMAQHYGVENMSIWAFRNLGKFTVINPCKVLKTYHLHCSQLRDAQRRMINSWDMGLALAYPTDDLYSNSSVIAPSFNIYAILLFLNYFMIKY